MLKGLGIMLLVFLVIGILHFTSLKLLKLSKDKKLKFKKLFYYIYGAVFVAQGAVRMIEEERFLFWSLPMILLGVFIIVLNYLGKAFDIKK